ncbi:MAG: PEP/pyruvate-binding domain-containing protein, partial [Planctomycetota bacterium]
NCLYRIEEILGQIDEPFARICTQIIRAIPPGWQYAQACQAMIVIENTRFSSTGYEKTPWVQSADIKVHDSVVGTLSVSYRSEMPAADNGPFLKEESKLIRTIADRLGQFIMHQKMRRIIGGLESVRHEAPGHEGGNWEAVIEMLQQTDKDLYLKIARKMLNHLCWSGVKEAEELLQSFSPAEKKIPEVAEQEDWNIAREKRTLGFSPEFSSAAFDIAAAHLPDREIIDLTQRWIQEDKISSLARVVNRSLSLAEVADAIRRYQNLVNNDEEIVSANKRGIAVSLIRRFLGDQLQYINVAKNFVGVRDFSRLLKTMIFSSESHGKLGGKGAGVYLAAQILKMKGREEEILSDVKTPKTWYITSDVQHHFMQYNNFDEVIEQKYKELSQVRVEYPHIIQTFKSGLFPPDIINSLSVALDDFGDRPLIVRSSSLLEDRFGSAFSGKYKSIFLVNQGSKQKRLEALTDAIAEVYASVFGPDPIEYRIERGLLDFNEEMAILIQEVVGHIVGRYFLPSYGGVAFSNNEFRWSPRIKREDGLIRLVPGLGTRAVDRLSDDYPMLIAPGQPALRANASQDEILRYSPQRIDVLNLDTNRFETIEVEAFVKEVGNALPGLGQIISIYKDGHMYEPMALSFEIDGKPVVTFERLISNTRFVKRMKTILNTLEEALGTPVDIEFASDGRDFYLLQCRPQCYSKNARPAPIPRDIPKDRILFSANRYISNGWVPDITHVVLVDPDAYGNLPDRASLIAVGRAVGQLNKLLPKRQFILMGPGRWGSRGDIKLGVNVTYSDINNTAVLVEIAVQKGKYLPELSFGTHFFQDLVEANIRYLPLYPGDEGVVYNESFFRHAHNLLPTMLPEYANLAGVVKLIDIPANTDGQILRVLMNADLDEASGMLAEPGSEVSSAESAAEEHAPQQDKFWRWRLKMAERIAMQLDTERYGVAGVYVFGSTKNATAGPGSDIDLLIHSRGTPSQREMLNHWLEGWSLCLDEMNYMRTGYRSGGLLDVQIVTDEDIEQKTSYAAKINAVTDAARPLLMRVR